MIIKRVLLALAQTFHSVFLPDPQKKDLDEIARSFLASPKWSNRKNDEDQERKKQPS